MFSIVGIFLVICTTVSGNANAGWFNGTWQSSKHETPHIVLQLKNNKLVSIVIDGKNIPMKLAFTNGKQGNTLLELTHEVARKDGSEQEENLYIVRGKVKSKFAFVGFYTYQEYDSEGVEKAGTFTSVPVRLYQQ